MKKQRTSMKKTCLEKAYADKGEAREKLREIKSEGGPEKRVVKCGMCNQHHLRLAETPGAASNKQRKRQAREGQHDDENE